MFLSDLDNLEKRTFLELATMMVSADGKITSEERAMLRDAAEEMELDADEEVLERQFSLQECCNNIILPSSRVRVLLELASFAVVDHDYDAHEKELLRAVGNTWHMDEILVMEIEQWASRRVKLATEAAELIYEAEAFNRD